MKRMIVCTALSVLLAGHAFAGDDKSKPAPKPVLQEGVGWTINTNAVTLCIEETESDGKTPRLDTYRYLTTPVPTCRNRVFGDVIVPAGQFIGKQPEWGKTFYIAHIGDIGVDAMYTAFIKNRQGNFILYDPASAAETVK